MPLGWAPIPYSIGFAYAVQCIERFSSADNSSIHELITVSYKTPSID